MSDKPTCPVTMYPNVEGTGYNSRSYPCGEPLAPDADFCEQHEKARVRLLLGLRR